LTAQKRKLFTYEQIHRRICT